MGKYLKPGTKIRFSGPVTGDHEFYDNTNGFDSRTSPEDVRLVSWVVVACHPHN